MLTLLSPAKTLDLQPAPASVPHTRPRLHGQTEQLLAVARTQSPEDLAHLMGISPALAELNFERFQQFSSSRRATRGRKQAVLAFAGDVYTGLDAPTLTAKGLEFAHAHLRILSGLYGLLRPLDLIQPYRLEMGTRLANPSGPDLYAFWGDQLARALTADLRGHDPPVVVNLASQEYARAARLAQLPARVVTPVFKERRKGRLVVISFSAKRARGAMARFIVDRRIDRPQGLRRFEQDGYALDEGQSNDDTWVYVRDQPR